MEKILILALLVLWFVFLWRMKVNRDERKSLEKQIKAHRPQIETEHRLAELETDLMIERMRMQGVEKLLSQKRVLVYSHSVGICVKVADDKCCIPLDEAILRESFMEVTNE